MYTTNPMRAASKVSSSLANFDETSSNRDVNVLLLGHSGVGKSTLINALANYFVYDTLEEGINNKLQVLIPFNFYHVDLHTFEERHIEGGKPDEYEDFSYDGRTCTQKCRSFVFRIGNRTVRLIDTPPVSDTRGPEQDIRNFNDIKSFIIQYEHLDGICILLRSNYERLDIHFRYPVTEILRLLPKGAMENIIFLFTNARATFHRPGESSRRLRVLFSEIEQKYGLSIPFTSENSFLLDNEGFRYLALCANGIQFTDNDTLVYRESWNHSMKEISRFLERICSRPHYTVRNMTVLHEVQQIISILCKQTTKLLSVTQIYSHVSDLNSERMKIEDAFRKLCQYIQVNSVIPFNKAVADYINCWLGREKGKQNAGAENNDVIDRLQTLRSDYLTEIDFIKTTIENEKQTNNKTKLIEPGDIYPLVASLYQLNFSGPEIRKQVEEMKANLNKAEQREVIVELPKKAESSKLMRHLKKILS